MTWKTTTPTANILQPLKVKNLKTYSPNHKSSVLTIHVSKSSARGSLTPMVLLCILYCILLLHIAPQNFFVYTENISICMERFLEASEMTWKNITPTVNINLMETENTLPINYQWLLKIVSRISELEETKSQIIDSNTQYIFQMTFRTATWAAANDRCYCNAF